MMKAVFLWKEHEASGDVKEILPVCIEKARSVGWTEELKLFSEGYGPGKSWDDLITLATSGNLTGVILHDIRKWHGKGQLLKDNLALFQRMNIPVVVALLAVLGLNPNLLPQPVKLLLHKSPRCQKSL